MHPEMMSALAEARLETLRRAAEPRSRREVLDDEIVIRVAGGSDRARLDRLAALEHTHVAAGPHVVADVGGRLVAAVSLADGRAFADPFVETRQIVRLLELRARQLREPTRPRRQLPLLRLRRGSTAA